jgi:hypothetical protein
MHRIHAVLIVLALAALGAPATASASHRQFTIFEANRELRSDDAQLRAQTLDEIRAFGVRWVRVLMYWRDVAPQGSSATWPGFDERSPAGYDWHLYDRIVAEARARGLHVLLTPTGPAPRWATYGRHNGVDHPSPGHFERFMQAAGTRYRDTVSAWSIWNEPNHPDFLGPQFRHGRPYSPRIYRKLFQAAMRGLRKSGNRHDRVLMGETAPRGNRHVVAPLAFLRGTLCLDRRYRKHKGCGMLRAAGYAHHAYTTHAGPRFVSRRRDDVTIGSLSRLRRALDRAARAHAVRRHLGIYLTEFGIQSKPDPYYGVSETRQAAYRAISEKIAYDNPRVRAFSQYLLRDDLPRKGRPYVKYGGFESGLRHSDGRRKKAYGGFALPLVAHRASRRRVRLWGLVRPAHGRTRVTIEYRNAHGHRWRRLKRDGTDHRGYWRTTTRYRGGRSYRVVWGRRTGARTWVTRG